MCLCAVKKLLTHKFLCTLYALIVCMLVGADKTATEASGGEFV